jgi:hypothetical protein
VFEHHRIASEGVGASRDAARHSNKRVSALFRPDEIRAMS